MNVLQYLLEPEGVTAVLAGNPFYRAGSAEKFDLFLGYKSFCELMNTSSHLIGLDRGANHPRIRVFQDGREIKCSAPREIISAHRAGGSIIIDNADRICPNLGLLCDSISAELNIPSRANIYYSDANSPAFKTHYDTHDVIILGCGGEKVWNVYEERVPNPVFYARQHPNTIRVDPPILNFTVARGDALYIPKGTYHDALASNNKSLHVTLALFAPNQIDFLNWLADLRRDISEQRQTFPVHLSPHSAKAIVEGTLESVPRGQDAAGLAQGFTAHVAGNLLDRCPFTPQVLGLPPTGRFRVVKRGLFFEPQVDGTHHISAYGRRLEGVTEEQIGYIRGILGREGWFTLEANEPAVQSVIEVLLSEGIIECE